MTSLADLSGDELRAALSRRIDCPVAWCEGAWLEHGGDGREPETWLHQDGSGLQLPHGAALHRSQEGTGQVEWGLSMRGDGANFSMLSGSDPQAFAHVLREIADAVDFAET